MPELRKDSIIDRWVIIASERARRPGNFIDRVDTSADELDDECEYCNTKENPTVVCDGGVKVYPVKDPLITDGEMVKDRSGGLYQTIAGSGHHEVILETDEHISNLADLKIDQIAHVIDAYASRITTLKEKYQFPYYVVYKNYGVSAGSRSITHARSHLVGLPVVPLRAKEKIQGAVSYFDENKRCVYCDAIDQEIKEQNRLICESENFIALIPFASRFLFEVQILPKNHSSSFEKSISANSKEFAEVLQEVFMKIKTGLDDCAYNFVIHTSPTEGEATSDTQERLEKAYHWHIEIMPRLTQMAGFEKGTGFYICPIPPEDMAEFLRGDDDNV